MPFFPRVNPRFPYVGKNTTYLVFSSYSKKNQLCNCAAFNWEKIAGFFFRNSWRFGCLKKHSSNFSSYLGEPAHSEISSSYTHTTTHTDYAREFEVLASGKYFNTTPSTDLKTSREHALSYGDSDRRELHRRRCRRASRRRVGKVHAVKIPLSNFPCLLTTRLIRKKMNWISQVSKVNLLTTLTEPQRGLLCELARNGTDIEEVFVVWNLTTYVLLWF